MADEPKSEFTIEFLTQLHLQKSLTTAHLSQALAQQSPAAGQSQRPAETATTPAQTSTAPKSE